MRENLDTLKIGVIGAGVMGAGVAKCFAEAGFQVYLIDRTDELLKMGMERMCAEARLVRLLSSTGKHPDTKNYLEKIETSTSIGTLAMTDIIIENVTEDWCTKEKVYQQLDDICKSSCIFVANPSIFTIHRIASITSRPKQVIGVHFMNPVSLKLAVELIVSEFTSKATTSLVECLLERIGKKVIRVGDSPGYVSNRVLMPLINNAIEIVQDGVASIETVDEVFRSCLSHQMGPLETADLIGLDTVLLSLQALTVSFKNAKYKPCLLLVDMVNQGYLGRKSGQGFYNYDWRGTT